MWKDDMQHGEGKEIWQDGSKYEGGYSMGKKEGHGVYVWGDGSQYEGHWQDNRINGYVYILYYALLGEIYLEGWPDLCGYMEGKQYAWKWII